MAADVSITPLKLIIVDKTATAVPSAKVVFVSKDAAITKGAGTDISNIDSQLDVSYDTESGSFVNPQGALWLVNKATVAKYVNKPAPVGGASKVSVLKPGLLIKNVAKSLGDTPIDISSAPAGDVLMVYTINNGASTTRHCGKFPGATCSHISISAGLGWKLVCKNTGAGATCPSSPSGAFID
jgi:hypothetical protein